MVVSAEGVNTNPCKTWKIWTQRRYILSIMVFFGYFNVYSLRSNLSIAILAMTQDRYSVLENGTKINIGPEFEWDNKIQGYLLSSFFYGYITTQLLGGVLAAKFGGKQIFGAGIASTALLTIVSPWLAEVNVYVLLVGRIFTGIFEGVTYSSLYCIWNKWLPPLERGRMVIQANSGSYTGTVFSMMFYAYLQSVAGWRSIFWFSGGLGLLWYAIWLLIISESPETDSKISKAELQYIQLSLEDNKKGEKSPVPWKALLTSKATWALNIGVFCETWGFYTLMTLLPKYFKDVFQFDISQSGILSALPYICIAIMMQFSGQLIDMFLRKKWLTLTQTRKAFMITGFLSQSCFMMGAAFWGNAGGTVFSLVMAVGLGSLAIGTITINSLDIAPKHASVVFGVANTWGTLPGVVSPIIAGYIVSTENPTVDQWRIVFYITAGLYLFGAIVYGTFASGVRQAWDYEDINKKKGSCDSTTQKNDSS